MHESKEHHSLVIQGADLITKLHGFGDQVRIDERAVLGTPCLLPQAAHQPDVVLDIETLLVIGEAKTLKDVLKKHSIEQYDDYMTFPDFSDRPHYFYLFVPWQAKPSVSAYLKNRYEYLGQPCVSWRVFSDIELAGL